VAIPRPIHDPAELALYGLPAGVWAWLIEPDANELGARGVNAAMYGVIVVAVDSWAADPDIELQLPGARPVAVAGLAPLDVRYLEVGLLGTPAKLVWSAPRAVGPRLDMFHIEGLKKTEIVDLYLARRLVDLDWGPLVGRPAGDTAMTAEEFETSVAIKVAEIRGHRFRLTQKLLAREISLNSTTLRKYLDRAGVRWRDVQQGKWPPK